MAVTTGPTAPTAPAPGDLWIDTRSGITFVWTVIVPGHGVWVQRVSPPPVSVPADFTASRVPNCTTASSPPVSPDPCDLWFDTITGFFFIYYDDGTSRQWVVTNPGRGGEIGPPGPQGPPGEDGVPGPQGDPGAKGDKGDKGDQGDVGPPGATGATGATGAKGDKGDTGATGAAGAPGAQGPQGNPGVQGPQGNPGATGPAGPGVPVGGTTGQALVKSSNADYATTWATLLSGASVGDTAPASPIANQLWWNSALGTLFIYYNDGNSSQWVPTSPSAAGSILQTVAVPFTNFLNASTILPVDNTVPQITEGFEIMTAGITPRSNVSFLDIQVTANLSPSVGAYCGMALFRDATVNALAAVPFSGNANDAINVPLSFSMASPGAGVLTTFRVRAGPNAAGNLYFNGISNAAVFGGVCMSSVKITERMP